MKLWIALSLSSAKGNAVVGAVINITLATLITLSVLALSLSAYNTLLIRDAAVNAASRLALPDTPSQQPYLQRLLDDSLPELAGIEITELDDGDLVGFRISSQLPLFGFLDLLSSDAEVLVAKEKIG
jgi:hypothetical protein